MERELLVECTGDQTRLAVVEDGELAEFYIERKGHEKLVGNIYKGRAANVLPGMEAAFVDIGMEKNGFLYAGDILVDKTDFGLDPQALEQELKNLSIKKLLKVGQEILVQVIKEPGGSKGPRLTSHITLPGRLAVLLPTVGYVGVSRRIEAEDERMRLRAMAEALKPQGMGLIIRTAAEGVCEGDLERDIRYLKKIVGFHLPAGGGDQRAGAFAPGCVAGLPRGARHAGRRREVPDRRRRPAVRAGPLHRGDALAGIGSESHPSCRGRRPSSSPIASTRRPKRRC